MNLKVDPERVMKFGDVPTGIYVRVQNSEGKWISADIIHLDKESLLTWLRSRGGENPLAENTVGILLGHEEHIVV